MPSLPMWMMVSMVLASPSQLGSLFACQFHKIPFDRSFLIVQSILPEAAGLPAFLLDGYFFK